VLKVVVSSGTHFRSWWHDYWMVQRMKLTVRSHAYTSGQVRGPLLKDYVAITI